MMRIGFLVSDITRTGGVQRVVSDLCNALSKTGRYKLCIVSLFRTDPRPWPTLNEGVEIDYIFRGSFDWRKSPLRSALAVRHYLRSTSFDLVVVSGMGFVPLLWLALLGSPPEGAPRVLGWEHQSFGFGKALGSEWLGKRLAVCALDGVVVLTKEDQANYQAHFGKKQRRIYHAYNMTNVQRPIVRPSLGARRIMSAGSLVERKGFIDAVLVAKEFLARHPDWRWQIFGDGPERETLAQAISAAGLDGRVILMGQVDDLDQRYVDHSLFVLTSRNEGLPTVIVEAMASGLPVVSYDCPTGPKELIDHGVNGFLVAPNDTRGLAMRLLELVGDEELWNSFSEAAPSGSWRFAEASVVGVWQAIIASVMRS